MKNLNAAHIPILGKKPDTPLPGQVAVYFKYDGLLYKLDAAGVEAPIEDIDVYSSFTIQLTNRSGGNLVVGNVVILDTNNPLSVTTTSENYSTEVAGVIKTGGANEAPVTVQFGGVADILMDAQQVNIADYIYSSTLTGTAFSTTSTVPGCFARALTSKASGSQGLVKGILAGGLPELF